MLYQHNRVDLICDLGDGAYRFANDEQLAESETCVMEFNKKESTYTLTLTGDVKDKKGKVKVVAKNNGGEASSEADLSISGRLPVFTEKPIKCTVLEGNDQRYDRAICKQVAQLSQRDRAAGWVSYRQKWKTGTGRQYLWTL